MKPEDFKPPTASIYLVIYNYQSELSSWETIARIQFAFLYPVGAVYKLPDGKWLMQISTKFNRIVVAAVLRSQRRRRKVLARRWPLEKTEESPNGVYGPSTSNLRKVVRTTKIPQRARPNGTGRQIKSQRYSSQNLVPKSKDEMEKTNGGRIGNLGRIQQPDGIPTPLRRATLRSLAVPRRRSSSSRGSLLPTSRGSRRRRRHPPKTLGLPFIPWNGWTQLRHTAGRNASALVVLPTSASALADAPTFAAGL